MRGSALGLAVLAVCGLGIPPASAQLRDLGTFGPTCPIHTVPPASGPGVRLFLRERPPERVTVATRLAYAPGIRQRRILPSSLPWPTGAPTTLAFVGTDPASLQVVRSLAPGSGVYLVSMTGWQDVKTVQGLCPTCLVQPGSDAAAALFRLTRYPALVQWTGWTGQELVVTEGP